MAKVIDVPGYGPTEFPDEMSDDQIVQAIQKNMVKPEPAKPTMRGTTGGFKPGASGSWEPQTGKDRFMRGFLGDTVEGLQGLAAETEIAGFVAPEWAKKKRAEIQANEKAYQTARAASGDSGFDWQRLGGQVVNPVNLGIAAITKTPPGASLPTRMMAGAAGGGLMGGMAPVHGDASRAEQTGYGMLGGLLAAPLSGGVARTAKPNVSPELALLRKSGVTPTIGQSMGGAFKSAEDKATSFPILGDAIANARSKGMNQFQKAGYSRALSPISGAVPKDVGFEGMQSVHSQLSKAYDDVLPKLNFKPDQTFIGETQQLRATVPATERKLFDNIVSKVQRRATPQGNMSGETFKNVESSLGEEIVRLAKDPSYEKGLVLDAVKQYRDIMRQGLERSNPMYAKQLQGINEGWANYAILRRAASGPQAAQTGNFSPAQLMQGVQEGAKRSGQAVGRGKLSEGRALMQDLATAGQAVLPSKYPDSGTAGRLLQNVILNPLVGVPQAITGATVGAVGSIPYLPGMRQGLDVLLNSRPELAGQLANTIRAYPGLLAPAITPAFQQ